MPVLTITGGQTQVEDIDYKWALSRRWHLGDTGYVKTYSGRPGGTPIRMHRLIMERMVGRRLIEGELVDHINKDKLDNRRGNLRLASKSQNGMNLHPRKGCKSRYIGVGYYDTYDHRLKPWMSYVNFEGKRWYLGRYKTQEEAAWMRDQWAVQLHGEFASLNFDYPPVDPNF